MAADYYKILGVEKTASQDEIKSAYRKLVKQYHPDLHPGDEKCAEKFKEINEANEILSDPEKRKQYDFELEHPGASSFGGAGGFSGQGFSGFSDIFGDIFSQFTGGGSRAQRNTKGDDVTIEVELSFLDAAKGCRREINYMRKEPCKSCKGNGSKDGTAFKTCDKCQGTGQVQYSAGNGFFRTVSTRACPACGGLGKIILEKCPDCGGKGYNRKQNTVVLDIPAGADTGSYMTKKGAGNASPYGGECGDLIVLFKVAPHKMLTRKGFDLYVEVPISYKTAVLGGTVKVPTVDNAVDFDVPAGTQSGKTFVMRGKGIQSSRGGTGNLYITVKIEVPTKVGRSQKKMLEDFDDELEIKQYSDIKNYSSNVQSLYGVDPYEKK